MSSIFIRLYNPLITFLFVPQANEIDFRQITREEAVLILLALGEEVSLFVVPKKAGQCSSRFNLFLLSCCRNSFLGTRELISLL